MKTTGEIIRKYREDNRYTVVELALKLNISQVLLTYLENNKRNLSESVFEQMQKVFPENICKEIQIYEDYKKTPESIKQKIKTLETIKTEEIKLTKKDRMKMEEFLNEASLMFDDESINEEDKEKMLKSLTDMFYRAKLLNKRKN